MDAVGIERRESSGATAPDVLQYPGAAVSAILFTSWRETEDRRLGL
jgi:hypothetical protein